MRKIFLSHALAIGLAFAFSCAKTRQEKTAPPRVVIIHTNDLHGQARPAGKDQGGIAALAAKIKRVRAVEIAKGARVFVVDCGDFFQGTPEGDLTDGRLVIDCFNEIGYDMLCLGNHDFDRGPEVTAALSRRARFPFLCANVEEEASRQPPPFVVSRLSFKDVSLDFVGLITSDMPLVTVERARKGLRFPLELDTLATLTLRPRTVLLSHVGDERDREIAAAHSFLAIIGGHSHREICEFVRGTYIGQTGSRGRKIGIVEIGEEVHGRLEEVKPSEGEDPRVKEILSAYAPEIDKIMDVVVGELAEDLPVDGAGSSPLGNWLCDVMREATGAEVAFHNRTGIRAALKKGALRERDLYQVSPFHNTLITMKLTGRDLLDLLGHALSEPKLRLEVSGIEVTLHAKTKEIEVRVNGAPLDVGKTYRVVTNSFLAPGGDGHAAFAKGTDRSDTHLDLFDLHRDAVKKSSPVHYPFVERIHVVE